MFTFAWAALALGAATGKFPKPGEMWLVGGSPRYQLYPAKDGKIVACGAIEPKFWDALPRRSDCPRKFRQRKTKSQCDTRCGGKIDRPRTSDEWRPIFAKADCCTTIWCRLKRRYAIRILSSADCSVMTRLRHPAKKSRPCRCRLHRNCGTDRALRKRRSWIARSLRHASGAASAPARYLRALPRPQRANAIDGIKTKPARALYRQEIRTTACD